MSASSHPHTSNISHPVQPPLICHCEGITRLSLNLFLVNISDGIVKIT